MFLERALVCHPDGPVGCLLKVNFIHMFMPTLLHKTAVLRKVNPHTFLVD